MKCHTVLFPFFLLVSSVFFYPLHAFPKRISAKEYQIETLDTLTQIKERLKEFYRNKQYDSALVYSNKMLVIAERKGDSNSIAAAHFRLGFYHHMLDKNVEAFTHYNSAYRIHRALGDSVAAASRLNSMANIQNRFGDFSGARITALDALALYETNPNIERIASLYHIIARSHREEKNYKESLHWNNKIMDLIVSNPSEIKKNSTYIFLNSQATYLADIKQYNRSIAILENLLKDSILQSNEIEYARVLDNLGEIKWLDHPKNTESETLLLEALDLRQHNKSIQGLISSHIHLSHFYNKSDPERSLLHASKALENALKHKGLTAILEALDLVIPLKKKLRLPLSDEAALYSTTQNQLRETQQKVRAIYATTKYDNEQLAQENLKLQTVTAKKEKQQLMLIALLVITLLSAGFLAYYKNQQRKREHILTANKTEARISKKIHDELANDVSGVMNYVDTYIPAAPDTKEKLLSYLNSIYIRARDVSTETAGINLEDLPKSFRGLIAQHQTLTNSVVTNPIESINWKSLPDHKKIAVYRSVQELLVNTKKHARATQTTIAFKTRKRKREIIYTDNGIGFSGEAHVLNGLNNVETRMSSIGGSFKFESEEGKGFRASLLF